MMFIRVFAPDTPVTFHIGKQYFKTWFCIHCYKTPIIYMCFCTNVCVLKAKRERALGLGADLRLLVHDSDG